jgi:hypothetical protein
MDIIGGSEQQVVKRARARACRGNGDSGIICRGRVLSVSCITEQTIRSKCLVAMALVRALVPV